MNKPFKPMLAAAVEDVSALTFPLIASPKLDGIRCIVRNGVAYSRSNKPIRNRYIQQCISEYSSDLEGLDGELIVGSPTACDVYRVTNSAVMSADGTPDFKFFVFDRINREGFADSLRHFQYHALPPFAKLLDHTCLTCVDELLEYEQAVLESGYEGVMLRHPDSPYKQNRSTLNEGYLMKLKRFSDAEAVCIGYGELMHNGNEAKTNELGHTDRSSAKGGLYGGNTLGYLLCKTDEGVEFKIGTGFTQTDRRNLWEQAETLIGRTVKFKFLEIGIKEAPRHPVWLGFRDADDM